MDSITLQAQDSLRLRIQLLPYRPPGLSGKDYFRTTVFFSRQLCNLACCYLIGWSGTISRRECIHQTTLNCNITPNISSILQRLFHGGRTEAAQQHGIVYAYSRLHLCTNRHSFPFLLPSIIVIFSFNRNQGVPKRSCIQITLGHATCTVIVDKSCSGLSCPRSSWFMATLHLIHASCLCWLYLGSVSSFGAYSSWSLSQNAMITITINIMRKYSRAVNVWQSHFNSKDDDIYGSLHIVIVGNCPASKTLISRKYMIKVVDQSGKCLHIWRQCWLHVHPVMCAFSHEQKCDWQIGNDIIASIILVWLLHQQQRIIYCYHSLPWPDWGFCVSFNDCMYQGISFYQFKVEVAPSVSSH